MYSDYNQLHTLLPIKNMGLTDSIILLIFMLPKINDKSTVIPYHSFAKELFSHKFSQNNINKLKLIKEFLEDQQNCFKIERSATQMKKCTQPNPDQYLQSSRLKTIKIFQEKENQNRMKKCRRQSLTAETKMSQQLQKPTANKQKSIFCVPDRFKLNQFFQGTGRQKKSVIIQDLLKAPLKVSNPIYTHRIV